MVVNIPNQLTLIRIILTPVFVYLFVQEGKEYQLAGSLVFVAAAFTDWYDGYFARRFHSVSRWGQFMDPLADKILVSSAFLVFSYTNYIFWWMTILIIIRDGLITFLRSFALAIGKPIITSIFAKWKTFLQMAFVFALLLYLNIPGLPDVRLDQTDNPWMLWTTLSLCVVLFLNLFSGIQYLIVNRFHLLELGQRILRLIHG